MTWSEPTHDSLLARMQRLKHPGSGWCMRCGKPWPLTTPHTTQYNETNGCFPLCEDCWNLLGCGEARIEYYGMLLEHWDTLECPVSKETRFEIQRAVANGK